MDTMAALVEGAAADLDDLTYLLEDSTGDRPPDALCIYSFGSPKVRHQGVTLPFLRRKSLALLVYLAATRRPHTREALATLLWGNYSQERALANLRKVLSELHEHVGGAIAITRQTVSLDADAPVWFDADAFKAAVSRGIAAHDPRALVAAAEHYRDEFLAGFNLSDADEFEEWLLLYREHVHGQLIEA